MRNASGEAVKLPDRYHVELTAVGVGHQSVERGPAVLRSAHGVNVLPGNGPASPLAILAQFARLHGHVLAVVGCRDSRVNGGFHLAPAFGPGVRSILRALAISPSVHLQSVRAPPIGTATDGLIFPTASQRLTVRKATPIFAAASAVLNVFFIRSHLSRPHAASNSDSRLWSASLTLFRTFLQMRRKSGAFSAVPCSRSQILARCTAVSLESP